MVVFTFSLWKMEEEFFRTPQSDPRTLDADLFEGGGLKNRAMNNLESIKERISNVNPSYIELCSDFLILYSRFEFALKESGFLQGGNRVLASIEDYAVSISEYFKPEPDS
jgi:hypothetical protein